MEGDEERGIVSEENSQKDAVSDETSRQKECSQTPQLSSCTRPPFYYLKCYKVNVGYVS
jgi:hypothetical protein